MIKPLRDRILVKRVSSAEMHAGIIHIPDAAREKANVGVVVAVGEGRRSTIPEVVCEVRDSRHYHGHKFPRLEVIPRVNETVLFGKYSGHDFEHEGETYLFLREDEVLAILEEGEQQ